ncbi:MAG: START domain-containing protein [Pseudomonadales bacterium]
MKAFCLMLFVMLSAMAASEPAWQLVKGDNKVSVYTRLESESAYKSFKAIGEVKASSEQVLNVLNDVSSFQSWFAYAKTVELLEQSELSKLVYIETDFPWPFRNQDMVYEMSFTELDDGSVEYALLGKPGYIPVKKGINRMRSAKGNIRIMPYEDHTKISYLMQANLSGEIPPWLANKHIHELPFRTLENLLRLLEDNLNI